MSTVTISLPGQIAKKVDEEIKKQGFATRSEFIRSLLRMYMEGRLVNELEKSREELKAGKGKLLRSLRDIR